MKKLLLLLLALYAATTTMALQKGDSLAILYYKVWVYQDPDDLATRLGPYSYFDKKMVYLETSTEHEGWYKVLTPDGKEAFVKESRVSTDPNLTHKQIRKDISDGLRKKRFDTKVDMSKYINFRTWKTWVAVLLILAGLFFFWKYYTRIDQWYCRQIHPSPQPLAKPWFITFSLVLGMLIGSIHQIIKPTEADWFLTEGIRLWANYPSFWDWILWGIFVAFSFLLVAAVIQAFMRFSIWYAVAYSLISLFLSFLYFFIGLLTGGLAFLLLLLYLFIMAQPGNSSSGDYPNQINVGGKTYTRTWGNNYRRGY